MYHPYSYRITIDKNPIPLQQICVLSYLCLLLTKVLFETSFKSFQYNTEGRRLSNYSIKLILCSHYRSLCKGLCQNKKHEFWWIYKGRSLLRRTYGLKMFLFYLCTQLYWTPANNTASMTHSPLIIQTFRINWVICIPLSLGQKTQRRAKLLLPTWVNPCRSGETVSFAFSLTKNVTSSISLLQSFRFWEAISHLCPPVTFLSQSCCDSSCEMSGLAPHMDALFCERCFSVREMAKNVGNRLLWNSASKGVLKNIKPLSPDVTWYSGLLSYAVTSSIDQTKH